MNRAEFLVQGSADEPYHVTFIREGANLSAFCTCPAGVNGQYCKHRFNILAGCIDGIASGNEREVATVASWLEGSDVEAALLALAEAEREVEQARKRLSRAKKSLAAAMRA